MRKIAVGDLGEFWYGDYKEPFVQLEGAVPGYPQGVLLKDDDGRLLCPYCGRAFHNLGTHATTHGLSGRSLKDEMGLLASSALISDQQRQIRIATALRTDFGRRPGTRTSSLTPSERAKRSGGARNQWKPERLNMTGRCYAQVLEVGRQLVREGRFGWKGLGSVGIGPRTVGRYFGSIHEFRRLIGAPPLPRQWRRSELLVALRSIAGDLGRTPALSDLRRFGLPTTNVFTRLFGSYSEACRAAGLDPNLPFPDGRDLDLAILVAYATTAHQQRAAEAVHVAVERVQSTLHRYGFPWSTGTAQSRNRTERRAWAAEMARRLATPVEESVA